jgi:uncharacterized protein YhaN
MRLRRIEAVRFGKIDGLSLGDLSPGLTVVHGPNESGKSSLTALVRHVLYGFPTAGRRAEAPYSSGAGKRLGRLVFTDPEGEWVIERGDGPRGGTPTVSTLSGPPRPDLISELTAGVPAHAYRIVYGFGLAEMQQIADTKSQEDNLLAKFYAASAGLEVDPGEVRAAVEGAMESLWKKNGSTPELNRMKAEREQVRAEARALEAEADALRADAARLEALEADLDDARSRRTETDVRAKRVGRVLDTAERTLAEADAAEQEAQRLDREAAAARSQSKAVVVDPVATAAADTVDALFEELSGFREKAGSLATAEARLAALDVRLRSTVAETGWSVEAALAAASDAGAGPEIEAARDRIFRAMERLDMAVEARDAARVEGAVPVPPAGAAARPWLVPGLAIAVIGAVGMAAGLVLSQTAAAAIGALMVAAGLVLALAVRSAVAPGGQASRSRVTASEAACEAAQQALDAARHDWAEWVRSHGLGDGNEEPAAIFARYQAARAARTTQAERAELATTLERVRATTLGYAARVGEAIAPLLGEPLESATIDRAAEFMNRARALVADAREAGALQRESTAEAERLEREAAGIRARGAAAIAEAEAALAGVDAGTLEEGRALLVGVDVAAADAAGRFEGLLQEVTGLRARLGSERRDTALAELRLTEETLSERIAAGVGQYAVMAVACRLLALAQERFERLRKGPIVECAEAALSAMTEGRYARISVPMGKDAIEVFTGSSAAIAPEDLSRGTAEQLYLALRLGLIEQSGQVGAHLPVLMDDVLVNFSPSRMEQAARAIGDLASRRQVVFFTCHPVVADLLCGVAPEAVRLELAPPS